MYLSELDDNHYVLTGTVVQVVDKHLFREQSVQGRYLASPVRGGGSATAAAAEMGALTAYPQPASALVVGSMPLPQVG